MQCQATTSSGDQCTREASDGEHCWQHAEDNLNTHGRAYDPDRMADLIREEDGNLSAVAARLDCSRTTVYRYCQDHQECREAKEGARGELVDLSRSTYREVLEDPMADDSDKLKAANQVTRKYDETTEPDKREVSGPDGGPIATKDESDIDLSELSDDELDALEGIVCGGESGGQTAE